MNIPAVFEQAQNHFRAANYVESEALCNQLLNQNIRDFKTLQLLGLAQGMLGKTDNAIASLESAIKKDKRHAGAYSNLGNFYLQAGRSAEAIKTCKKAVKLNPELIDPQINLGNAYFLSKQFLKAEKAYLKILRKYPDSSNARENLAQCLTGLGRLTEAAQQCQMLIQNTPSRTSAYICLFNVLMFMHNTEDADGVVDQALVIQQTEDGPLFELLIGKAKLAWLTGKLNVLSELLQLTSGIYQHCDDYPNIKNLRIYHGLLETLLKLRNQEPELYVGTAEKPLIFVAESHCLAASETHVVYRGETYRVLSALITGCKAWHLGQKKGNPYKSSVTTLFRSLPEKTLVVLGFGEIDCRRGEGIFKAYSEKGVDYRKAIPEIVGRYIDFSVKEAQPFGHRLIFYGVPAPSPSVLQKLTPENSVLLCTIIQLFNQSIRCQCRERHFTFLDVFAASQAGGNNTKLARHIDDYHLHPDTLTSLFAFENKNDRNDSSD